MILLQVGCIELDSEEVTFKGYFEGLNNNQYFCMIKFIKRNRDHQRWLQGGVHSLTKVDTVNYVDATIKFILKFLQME